MSKIHCAGTLGSTHPHGRWISSNIPRIQPFHLTHITQTLLLLHLDHCCFGLYSHLPVSDPESIWKDEFPRSHCHLLFASLRWLLTASLSCQVFCSHFQELSPHQPSYPFKALASLPMLDLLTNGFDIKVITFWVSCGSLHTGRHHARTWTFQDTNCHYSSSLSLSILDIFRGAFFKWSFTYFSRTSRHHHTD